MIHSTLRLELVHGLPFLARGNVLKDIVYNWLLLGWILAEVCFLFF